jgi:1-aminocyclopropane-1-carboxylate deaminase/D-cysteine desulfhydrase-like pyridoxal-dependent ACC family enzyme
MQLQFTPRKAYALKDEADYLNTVSLDYPQALMIPEGGAGSPGILGSEEILAGLELASYSHILCAIGTGTMFTGLVNASLPHQRLIGIPVLKDMEILPDTLARNVWNRERIHSCRIFGDYHFGGYAKWNPTLLRFMNQFYEMTSIPSDFVYTGKLFYAFSDLVRKKQFPPQSRLLLIHSGGLQGNRSLVRGSLVF